MKIAVAMSGGVDSSSAAALLKEQGHELVGFTMQLWNQRRHINVDENGDPLQSKGKFYFSPENPMKPLTV